MTHSSTKSVRLVAYTDAESLGGSEQAPILGGSERVLATLLGALSPRFEVTVLGVTPSVVEWIAGHRPGTRSYTVPPVRHKADIAPILAHIRAVRRLSPDIFHANLRHSWSAQYGILGAALTRGARIVAVDHSPVPPSNDLQRRLRRIAVRWYSAYVAPGERSARQAEALLDLKKGRVRTIYNGAPWAKSSAPVDRASAGPVVGTVARLSREKGLDVLIAALAELPGVTAVLVGDGPERQELERQAESLGIADRVVFAGHQLEPENYLGSFDVFVLPSRVESFALANLEAMLACLPIVATDVGSVAEVSWKARRAFSFHRRIPAGSQRRSEPARGPGAAVLDGRARSPAGARVVHTGGDGSRVRTSLRRASCLSLRLEGQTLGSDPGGEGAP